MNLAFEMKLLLPSLLFLSNLLPVGLGPVCYGQTHVQCVGKNLDFFPKDLSKDVQLVDLSENDIRDLSVDDLKKYPKITSLLLGHNQIEGHHNLSGISQLKKLKEFDISNNGISVIDLAVFKENLELESLIANDNPNLEITETAVDLPNIKNISIEGCQLSAVPLKALSKLKSLEMLHLRSNNITTLPLNFLMVFPKLKELWVSNNPISCVDPALRLVIDVTTHPNCSFGKAVVTHTPSGITSEDVEASTDKGSTTTTTTTRASVTERRRETHWAIVCIFLGVLVFAGYRIYCSYKIRRREEILQQEEHILTANS